MAVVETGSSRLAVIIKYRRDTMEHEQPARASTDVTVAG